MPDRHSTMPQTSRHRAARLEVRVAELEQEKAAMARLLRTWQRNYSSAAVQLEQIRNAIQGEPTEKVVPRIAYLLSDQERRAGAHLARLALIEELRAQWETQPASEATRVAVRAWLKELAREP
ncbi:hypothetical protein [Curtobacterium sp. MCBD17_040]|uniref:hypothetical protein n=1 Tax=Curtobacterium sp. MCBD17_040 TaxID=2175674 RepID=UPI0011B62730|nr:hypothetical protein [Curtobacterium sp. MCBD17_040]WIB65642.1 hypothetical protein DEI94_16105 [Curtobacterium sp. MCBD17_040]